MFPKPMTSAMQKMAAPPVPLKPPPVPAPSTQSEATAPAVLLPPPPPRTASVGSLANGSLADAVPEASEQNAEPLPPPPPPRRESSASAGSEGQFPVSSQALLQAIREEGSKKKHYISPRAKKNIPRTPKSARSKALAMRRRALEESPQDSSSSEPSSPFSPVQENKTKIVKAINPVISPKRSPRPAGRTFNAAKILDFGNEPKAEKPARKFSAADLGSQKTQLRKENNPGETPRKRTLNVYRQGASLTRFFKIKPAPVKEASIDESPTP